MGDGEIGLGLLDLLIDGLHAEAGFLEGALAFAVVVLDDEVFLLGERAHGGEIGHLDGAEEVGGGEGDGAGGAEFAAGKRANDDVAALHFGGWD